MVKKFKTFTRFSVGSDFDRLYPFGIDGVVCGIRGSKMMSKNI